LIRQLAKSDCDAVVQIGTALPMIELIDELENDTGKTIIACNAALYWQTLRLVGIGDSLDGFGSLFSEY